MREYDVFISYSRSEQALAEPLRVMLEALGLHVFFDLEGGVFTGDAFPLKINEAIRDCKAVLACWTPTALKSEWCRRECLFASQLGKLVPLALAELNALDLGSEFITINYSPMADYTGQAQHLGWSEALKSIARLMDQWAEANAQHSEASAAIATAARVRQAALSARPAAIAPTIQQATSAQIPSPLIGDAAISHAFTTWESIEANVTLEEARSFRTDHSDPAFRTLLYRVDHRIRVLEDARAAEAEERKKNAEREERDRLAREAAEAHARRVAEDEARRQAEAARLAANAEEERRRAEEAEHLRLENERQAKEAEEAARQRKIAEEEAAWQANYEDHLARARGIRELKKATEVARRALDFYPRTSEDFWAYGALAVIVTAVVTALGYWAFNRSIMASLPWLDAVSMPMRSASLVVGTLPIIAAGTALIGFQVLLLLMGAPPNVTINKETIKSIDVSLLLEQYRKRVNEGGSLKLHNVIEKLKNPRGKMSSEERMGKNDGDRYEERIFYAILQQWRDNAGQLWSGRLGGFVYAFPHGGLLLLATYALALMLTAFFVYGVAGFLANWLFAPGLAVGHVLAAFGLGPFGWLSIIGLALLVCVLIVLAAWRLGVEPYWPLLIYIGLATVIWWVYALLQWFTSLDPIDHLMREAVRQAFV